MIRHILKNKDLILIGLVELSIGIVVLFKYRQLNHILPPSLDWTDDMLPGFIYLGTGLITLINAIWDFWWYKIRSFLIVIAGFLFAFLATSFNLDAYYSGHVTFTSLIVTVLFVYTFLVGFDEKGYKMKGKRGNDE